MKFDEFKKQAALSTRQMCLETLSAHRDVIRIKKERVVVKNLEKIFDATLRISNKKGFQAMSMRDLSRETGLSLGALYAYFPGKEELLAMLQHQRRNVTRRILEAHIAAKSTPWEKLQAAVRTHLYLSEVMQPWFYFSYMEAKNLDSEQQAQAVASELFTEQLFEDILRQGEKTGDCRTRDHRMSAAVLKAMLQDWYLKRGKYAKRRLTVDQYADFVLDMISAFYRPEPTG